MKVRMLNTVRCVSNRNNVFHKGRTYNAVQATNQPNYKENGLVFVSKTVKHGGFEYEMLINKGDYITV